MSVPTLLLESGQVLGIEQNRRLAAASGALMAVPLLENRQSEQFQRHSRVDSTGVELSANGNPDNQFRRKICGLNRRGGLELQDGHSARSPQANSCHATPFDLCELAVRGGIGGRIAWCRTARRRRSKRPIIAGSPTSAEISAYLHQLAETYPQARVESIGTSVAGPAARGPDPLHSPRAGRVEAGSRHGRDRRFAARHGRSRCRIAAVHRPGTALGSICSTCSTTSTSCWCRTRIPMASRSASE